MFGCGRMKKESTAGIRRADWVLLAVCLLSAVLSALYLAVSSREGSRVVLCADGAELYEMDLPEQGSVRLLITCEDQQTPRVSVYEGEELPQTEYNLLCAERDGVRMLSADCTDQICVRHRKIKQEGESIICLPHKLTVEIRGGAPAQETLDGMVK